MKAHHPASLPAVRKDMAAWAKALAAVILSERFLQQPDPAVQEEVVPQCDELYELAAAQILGIPDTGTSSVHGVLLNGEQVLDLFAAPIEFKCLERILLAVRNQNKIAEAKLFLPHGFSVEPNRA